MRRVACLLIGLSLNLAALAADVSEKPILVLDAGGHTAMVRKVLFTPGRQGADHGLGRQDDPGLGRGQRRAAPRAPAADRPGAGGHALRRRPLARRPDPGGGGLRLRRVENARSTSSPWTTGRIERVLKGHTNVIFALAFAPDGRRLASGSFDKTARIWDVASGRCEQVLKGHTNQHLRCCLLTGRPPPGHGLVRQDRADLVGHRRPERGRCSAGTRRRFTASPGARTARSWPPAAADQSIRLWRPDGTLHPELRGPGEPDRFADLHRRLPRAAVHMGQ